jgi:hypothetical protein
MGRTQQEADALGHLACKKEEIPNKRKTHKIKLRQEFHRSEHPYVPNIV